MSNIYFFTCVIFICKIFGTAFLLRVFLWICPLKNLLQIYSHMLVQKSSKFFFSSTYAAGNPGCSL